MEKRINAAGQEFIESLFDYTVIDRKTEQFGTLRFIGESLNGKVGHENDYRVFMYTHMKSMSNKYGFTLGYGEEFVGVYATALSEATAALGDRFPDMSLFKSDWKVQMETMRYIKKTIEPILYAENNPHIFKTKVKDKNVFISRTETSLEAIQEAFKNNQGNFELSDDNILFGSKTDVGEEHYYEFNSVVKNMLENRARVMTKKQLDFYNKMKECYLDKNNGFVTKNQMLKEAGFTQSQYHKFLENIKKRAEKDFETYGKSKSLSEDYRKGLLRVLNNYIKVIEDKAGVNIFKLNATRIVQDNYEDEAFEVIILKDLTLEEKQHIVRTVKGQHYLTTKLIYKIYQTIKTYIEDNGLQDVKPSEVEGGYTESLLTDEQKKDVSSHYSIDAAGVLHPRTYKDITESDVV